MIIQYYADSLGMPRPGFVAPPGRYILQVANWLKDGREEEVLLVDRAKAASTILELRKMYDHDEEYYVADRKILIIHVGVVDCAPRPIPLSVRNMIGRLPSFAKSRVIKAIHHNRAGMLRSGFKYYLVPIARFRQELQHWLQDAVEKFDVICLISIAPTNPATERHSPGFSESIASYNQAIREVIEQINSNKIGLADAYSAITQAPIPMDTYVIEADGHHITQAGNDLYAGLVIEQLKKRMNA